MIKNRLSQPRATKIDKNGFTIIELMIATTVLSIILLLVTGIMISIGNLYYKGITQARVQDNTRSLTDEVTQNLELNDKFNTGSHTYGSTTVSSICIGTVRYSYIIGVQIGTGSGQKPDVLWRDTDDGTCTPQDLTSGTLSGGTELITPHSRLISFSIQPNVAGPYVVKIGVAYGDNDLLCSPFVLNSCSTPTAMSNPADFTHGDLLCKGFINDQFCATSSLTTTVVQRISSS